MQLSIYRGPAASGKTRQLEQIARQAKQDQHQIICGAEYDTADLELLVRHRAGRGAKVVCIDECTKQQIARLQELKESLPDDLQVHAAVASGGV